jgi:hypothetical protein
METLSAQSEPDWHLSAFALATGSQRAKPRRKLERE